VAHRTAEAKKNARANEIRFFRARFIDLKFALFYSEVNARFELRFGRNIAITSHRSAYNALGLDDPLATKMQGINAISLGEQLLCEMSVTAERASAQ
jgi:hypothetical protein